MKVKNIMFSGVMAAILGATGAHAAISVASQGYVDSKVGEVATSVSTLETNVAANKAAIEALDGTYATDAALNTAKEELQGAIDDEALAREQVDTALYSRLQELEKFSGDGEGSVAKQIADAVADEASLREAADTALQTQITANATGVSEAKAAAAKALTDAKAYTDTEVGKVDAKFANYTTTDDLNTTLANYAEKSALTAEETARKEADQVATQALANVYTKDQANAAFDAAGSADDALTAAKAYTDDLANGQVKTNKESIESINTTLGTMATSDTVNALTTRVGTAESDIDTLQAKDAELVADLAKKIEMPAACQNTYCVLSVNGETISWMPLTEPVDDSTNNL
jgi:hypothetical protein